MHYGKSFQNNRTEVVFNVSQLPPVTENNFRIWLKNVKFSNQTCLLLIVDIKKNNSVKDLCHLGKKITQNWSDNPQAEPCKDSNFTGQTASFWILTYCCKIVTSFWAEKGTKFLLLSWDIQWDWLLLTLKIIPISKQSQF